MRHISHILHLFVLCPVQLPAGIVLPKSSLLEVAGVPTEDFFLSMEYSKIHRGFFLEIPTLNKANTGHEPPSTALFSNGLRNRQGIAMQFFLFRLVCFAASDWRDRGCSLTGRVFPGGQPSDRLSQQCGRASVFVSCLCWYFIICTQGDNRDKCNWETFPTISHRPLHLKKSTHKTISETLRNVGIKTALQRLKLTQHLPLCGRECSCPRVTGLNRSHILRIYSSMKRRRGQLHMVQAEHNLFPTLPVIMQP